MPQVVFRPDCGVACPCRAAARGNAAYANRFLTKQLPEGILFAIFYPMTDFLQAENQKLRQAVDELSLLNDLASAISSTMPMEEINKMIVNKCLNRIRAEQGYISLVDNMEKADRTHTLVRVFDKSTLSVPFRLGVTLTGWMMRNQAPLLVNDAFADERFQGTEWNGMPIRSVLAVPLKVKNRLIGFMSLFNKKEGEFSPEDQRLLSIVAMQSAQTIEAARLYEEEKKSVAMQQEMQMAMTIQQNLLPKAAPQIAGFDVAGMTVSAKEVGGDYFDYLQLSDGRCGFVVADVAGKGLSAAMLMSNLQATVRGQAAISSSCSHCITNANRMMKSSITPGRFVTLFLVAVDPAQKVLSYSNGGHNPPYLFKSDGSFRELNKGGPILGVFDFLEYEEEKIQLAPGDVFIAFSDGVTEAFNEKEEQFGEERLIELLKSILSQPAAGILSAINDAVLRFAGNMPAADDLTLMVIKAL